MIRFVYHMPRGMGRTTALVDLVKKHDGLLVTVNKRMAEVLADQYGLRKDQVCSYRQLPDFVRGRKPRPIYIDDVDWLLRDLLGVGEIDGITVSAPDRESMKFNGYVLPPEVKEIAGRPVVVHDGLPPDAPSWIGPTGWNGEMAMDLGVGTDKTAIIHYDEDGESCISQKCDCPERLKVLKPTPAGGIAKGVLKKISKKGRGSKSPKARRGSKAFREDTQINEVQGRIFKKGPSCLCGRNEWCDKCTPKR